MVQQTVILLLQTQVKIHIQSVLQQHILIVLFTTWKPVSVLHTITLATGQAVWLLDSLNLQVEFI